jgi:hypothetical protein
MCAGYATTKQLLKSAIGKRLIVTIRGKYLQLPLAGEACSQRLHLVRDVDTETPGRLVIGVDHDANRAVPIVDDAMFGEAGVLYRPAQFVRRVRGNRRSVGFSASAERYRQGEQCNRPIPAGYKNLFEVNRAPTVFCRSATCCAMTSHPSNPFTWSRSSSNS